MPPRLFSGTYQIPGTAEQAEVVHVSPIYTSEIRVRRLPDDADHEPLNALLAHISILELDHLVQAAASGKTFIVEPLDDLLPRPGWKIDTQSADDASAYTLHVLENGAVHRGSRRELLLLLELASRSAIAPFEGQPPPHQWVQRLRNAHEQLIETLQGEPLFDRAPTDEGNIRSTR